MSPRTRFHRVAGFLAALLAMDILWLQPAAAETRQFFQEFQPSVREAEREDVPGGFSIAIDNDLFAPAAKDRDYTGGLAITFSGADIARSPWLPDPLLQRIDALLIGRDAALRTDSVHFSAQLGILSFTPQDTASADVIEDDRPYASLLHATSARQHVSEDGRQVRHTSLTIGVLGLSLTSDIHEAIHDAVGSERPNGYANQISAGGEPTVRYVIGESKLRQQRLALGSGLLETKTTAEMSVGFLTEASYALSTRIGAIESAWWTFNPERVDYIAQPSAVPRVRGMSELYFWAGVKLRVRAYNSFLQGQFRDSEHAFGSSELQHVIGEAWIGVTGQLHGGTQMSYAIRYQTAEIRNGTGHRDPVWAGVTLTHSFR